MPDEQTCLNYFDLYFTNVHPYVPVLNKNLFYQHWNSAREAISPLILEAMFAIGGRLAEDPGDGQQWLALASSKHNLSRWKYGLLTSTQDMRIHSWTFLD